MTLCIHLEMFAWWLHIIVKHDVTNRSIRVACSSQFPQKKFPPKCPAANSVMSCRLFLKIKFIFKKKRKTSTSRSGDVTAIFATSAGVTNFRRDGMRRPEQFRHFPLVFFCFRVDGPLINAIMGASEFTSDIFLLRGFRPIRTIPELITVLALWRLICERRWNETDTDR